MPALHCAITRSGTETMNSGAPNAGIERRPLNSAGIDIGEVLVFRRTGNPVIRSKDTKHHHKKAIVLFESCYWHKARMTKWAGRRAAGGRGRPGGGAGGERAA